MPPRLSLRRIFLCVLCCGGAVFLILSIQQRWSWSPTPSPPIRTIEAQIPAQVFSSPIVQTEPNFELKKKPWYFYGGTDFPDMSKRDLNLFPDQADGDRILEQLMYIPENYEGFDSPEKVILAFNGLGTWGQKSGSVAFHGCPVSRCSLVADKARMLDADAIIYKDHFIHPGHVRPSKQLWILYLLECPYHTQLIKFPNVFNWTATYRKDSDLVTPYERWTYYDPQVTQKSQGRDYAANKTKKVAWFVSNCGARNGRLAYARELGKYISVDIYGTCGPLKCPRTDRRCFEILEREYKFYLAFENSNCRDYITEKFYVNGLGQAVLPIVMGARPEDYEQSAPQGSYIHVDDFNNPEELAAYLHRLDKDDELYNTYFRWKGTGEFINTYFWCRLCAMLHAPLVPRHYEDINEWWRGPELNVKKKKILSYLGLTERDPANLFNKCPVSDCVLTENKIEASSSDAIIFMNDFIQPRHLRFHEQVWILYLLESPFNSIGMQDLSGVFNWTATYRRDSDIVTPYEKWTYYDDQVKEKYQTIDYTLKKTKKVAWLVSNCVTRNHRLQYVEELQNYISVDIYGGCGPLKCSNCFDLLKQYKFYLAFENSNCHDYITEKFFVNALSNDLIPIVMGPNKKDYLQVAPKNSFIHVNDFKNPKELADYLHFLDTHDAEYNSYFKWKGTGEFINTYFWCRLCALLHATIPEQSYKDVDNWWRGHGICSG
ncbi:hypothetical protein FQR65_LT11409 [Abscondita terminalis]|nr:hypothetical protein FQR65_LT11409 [Abscondita terminalis]